MRDLRRQSPLPRSNSAQIYRMRNEALLVALRRTAEKQGRLIAFVAKGLAPRDITVDEAMRLVADRCEFLGFGSKHRVKRIVFEPPPQPDPTWQACWRNTQSACLWTEGHYEPHQA